MTIEDSATVAASGIDAAVESREATLGRILSEKYNVKEESLIQALVALGEATSHITLHLQNYVKHSYAGSQNASGDEQLELDIQCDKAVFDAVRASGVFHTVASEETPEETKVSGDDDDGRAVYSLGCDPLDGSSIIDANFSVGSIYGIWPGKKLLGRSGREQVAAAVALYGPRTVLCVALPGTPKNQVFEVTLVRNRTEWEVSRESIQIEPKGKVFAPGNLRATTDHENYSKMMQYWIQNRYQLRYSGGMVPDVYHIFAKSKGIFTNVSSPTAKAKLRLLYEVAPIGLIVECSGGEAIHEAEDKSVLDIVIEDCDQRTGVCFGSKDEVAKYKEFMF
uniref:Fructose-bisphosphatase n=1 Tax=Grammatophora oceanica TaxID=210454 RepID=A0A7S1UY49_9STRA